ncbi:ATP-binding protein [Tessaracoccus caeni]|uniref:ATP-binding protein n=1 Tax=Tessaracoccus caeni TaxID=3031239 RepID=UPI0023D9AA20|nr:DUF234 domain-containing protein [Tessaracoccus caeni]MDF1488242.1 DUF234 domain-containing protein [Tessaracoccus caeni]
MFIGRQRQLGQLDAQLRRVGKSQDDKPGKALLIRGRRRVGKSRLVEEFVRRAGVPHLFFAASGRPVADELALFSEEAARSDLPGASLFSDVAPSSWDAALRLLASAVGDAEAIVVLDELPYIIEADPHFEGTLQRAFDRELSRTRTLLIGIGSDLSMMEALNEYGRPFHQRATEMIVPPLTPSEVGAMLQLPAADAFDAFLVTGGLPLICAEWEAGMSLWDYLSTASSDPTAALLVSGERSLAAEFPSDVQARAVLGAIGHGERTFANIQRASGDIPAASLTRALKILIEKRVVAVDEPLSTRPSKAPRYRVADPYLRFWFAFLGPHLPEIERGRGDLVLGRIRSSWTSWRGRAIEPVIREALELSGRSIVGSYWTRSNNPEIDIVVADKAPIAKRILGVGSIKWRDDAPFDAHDRGTLYSHRLQLPGADDDTELLVVSRAGCAVDGVTHITPDQLLAAYQAAE